jgi:hypothetical protein
MKKYILLGAFGVSVMVCGCESQQHVVNDMQPKAVQTAQQRAAFDLKCPAATAQVLSNEMIQTSTPMVGFAPPERAQSTVGVEGCGNRATYMVVCAQGGTGCVATGSDNTVC